MEAKPQLERRIAAGFGGFFSLLLLVADSAGFGLGISDFTKVKPDGSGAEGVGFRLASVFLEFPARGRRCNGTARAAAGGSAADSAGFGLGISDFTKVKPDGSGAEGVGFRLASVFLVRGSEPADEGVQAAPGLAERARTGSRRVGVAEKGTDRGVNLSFSELVEVSQEFQHVGAAATGQRERRPVVPQVLPERVPVAPLLILVPA
nr:hypothetical protein TorRG33x02_055670 [Ipomoea batatas]